jgi:addiction module RelE/StbE family toxin
MRVSYSPRAIAQIEEITSYIARDNPAAAAAMLERIERLTRLLSRFPLMGRATDFPPVRVIGVPQYPYVMFYRFIVDTDEVRILRVRHTARRPLPGYR